MYWWFMDRRREAPAEPPGGSGARRLVLPGLIRRTARSAVTWAWHTRELWTAQVLHAHPHGPANCLPHPDILSGHPCAGTFDDDSLDEPLLTNSGQKPPPRPKNVFALERTYLTWTHMAVTVCDMTHLT